jgi:hypothetical protein
MPDYLSRESLTNIAAEYRRQQQSALAEAQKMHDGACRAEGAAVAIEHLIKVCFEPQPTIVIEEPEKTDAQSAPQV